MTDFIAYSRQSKRDGTVDSVCKLCEKTVVTGLSIIDLVPAEIAHTFAFAQTVVNEYKELYFA
jgi:hypothetical protein